VQKRCDLTTESHPPRRLYRSNQNRMIAGVCGGIAEFLNVDPTLVRLGFVLLTFASGSGILLYLVLAIIVPRAPTGTPSVSVPTTHLNLGALILLLVGLALVAFGASSALEQVAPWLLPGWNLWSIIRMFGRFFWAGLLVVVGLIIVASALTRR
jgi:phage shock protein C